MLEYENIGRRIKRNDKYTYVDSTRIEDHGTRLYDVNGTRLPSVTTILGTTKNQQFTADFGMIRECLGVIFGSIWHSFRRFSKK